MAYASFLYAGRGGLVLRGGGHGQAGLDKSISAHGRFSSVALSGAQLLLGCRRGWGPARVSQRELRRMWSGQGLDSSQGSPDCFRGAETPSWIPGRADANGPGWGSEFAVEAPRAVPSPTFPSAPSPSGHRCPIHAGAHTIGNGFLPCIPIIFF